MVGAAPLEVSLAVEGLEIDVARPVGDHSVPVAALRKQPIDVPIGLEVARIEADGGLEVRERVDAVVLSDIGAAPPVQEIP